MSATDDLESEAVALLRRLTNDPSSEFRPSQLDAIRMLVGERRRVLLVQRTGWGKSAVYFIATRMLRDRDAGPTLLVSPLLALMRNQIEAAERMGVRAATINSANRDEWGGVRDELDRGQVDVLLISPERLANAEFRAEVLPEVGRMSGLLVVDEAHCISDWGHDFRPDYRRIVRVLDLLPAGVPVLCCTATANDRVVADVVQQLGADLEVVRGQLGREGLSLHVLAMPGQAQRLAWLAETIPRLEGTGIVYCLTVADTERVATWLQANGIRAVAYSGDTDATARPEIEQQLLSNELKVVVATSALGMGFDKPDLAFVVHYQSPESPIAYYQQVGRAGRALERSVAVLLRGAEDQEIHDYFTRSAFPHPDLARRVVELLAARGEPVPENEILDEINIRTGQLQSLLKILEVEGAVERDGRRWLRTLRPWTFDEERVQAVTAQRRTEQAQMRDYAETEECRMVVLRRYLDDPSPTPCGDCDRCTGTTFAIELASDRVERALGHLRAGELIIEPRKQLPDRSAIALDRRASPGRALSIWADGGWGRVVRECKEAGARFEPRVIEAAAALIRDRWRPEPPPTWVTFVPSLRHPALVADYAGALASVLGLPCEDVVMKVRNTAEQKSMLNSAQQHRNVRGAFEIRTPVSSEPLLLVDDVVDSRWTLTAIAWLLRSAGSGPVYPFALANSTGRSA